MGNYRADEPETCGLECRLAHAQCYQFGWIVRYEMLGRTLSGDDITGVFVVQIKQFDMMFSGTVFPPFTDRRCPPRREHVG